MFATVAPAEERRHVDRGGATSFETLSSLTSTGRCAREVAPRHTLDTVVTALARGRTSRAQVRRSGAAGLQEPYIASVAGDHHRDMGCRVAAHPPRTYQVEVTDKDDNAVRPLAAHPWPERPRGILSGDCRRRAARGDRRPTDIALVAELVPAHRGACAGKRRTSTQRIGSPRTAVQGEGITTRTAALRWTLLEARPNQEAESPAPDRRGIAPARVTWRTRIGNVIRRWPGRSSPAGREAPGDLADLLPLWATSFAHETESEQ